MLYKERGYTSDMSDEQWEIVRLLLFSERKGPGRPPELNLRRVADTIFYLVRAGCQWKNLPKDYPRVGRRQPRRQRRTLRGAGHGRPHLSRRPR